MPLSKSTLLQGKLKVSQAILEAESRSAMTTADELTAQAG